MIPKVRHVLETIRPGTIFFWDGDGAMSHDDQMRSLRLMGSDVIPAVREMSKELDLKGPFEVDRPRMRRTRLPKRPRQTRRVNTIAAHRR